MHLCGIMCFSSSIICLLVITTHGSAVLGHLDENGGPGTTRINSTEYRRNHQSSQGVRSILNSSHHKNYQKDLIAHEYLTPHISNSSARLSHKASHMLRKQRHAEDFELTNKVSAKSTADAGQQPADQDSLPSESSNDPPIQTSQNRSYKTLEITRLESTDPDVDRAKSSSDEDDLPIVDRDEDESKHDNEQSHEDNHGCHPEHDHHDHDGVTLDRHHQSSPKIRRYISGKVWLYASLSVIIISLCGLLSVAVIPIMQKWFYHTLLQFLVGLAVGSLSGDGLLHLMPHAILGGEESHDHSNHNHDSLSLEVIERTAIWRGLAALGGIFLFFIAERLLGAITAHRRQKKEAKLSGHTKSMMPVMQREDGANNGNVGEKLAQPKKNSYDHIREKDEKETIQMLQAETTPSRKGSLQSHHEIGFHGRSSFSLDPEMSVAYRPDSESSVIVSDHHGHNHGHSHEIPHSVSAVAWMVIMGDGLHNFCDGLAIGAAFASSDADGVSTTVAVFCHELPHELGDFAMLLKTGMKVKQALFYNGLSSILCFVGMVIGVCLGNVNSATNWVFAGTAGMFLYIALVDMLPELASGTESGKAAFSTLIVQVSGIAIGICIMLLIALYEHKLSSIVS